MIISTSVASNTSDSMRGCANKIKHGYDTSWTDDVHASFRDPINTMYQKFNAAVSNASNLMSVASQASSLNAEGVSGAVTSLASAIDSY